MNYTWRGRLGLGTIHGCGKCTHVLPRHSIGLAHVRFCPSCGRAMDDEVASVDRLKKFAPAWDDLAEFQV